MNKPKYSYNAINIIGGILFIILILTSLFTNLRQLRFVLQYSHLPAVYWLGYLAFLVPVAVYILMAISLLANFRNPVFPGLIGLASLGLLILNIDSIFSLGILTAFPTLLNGLNYLLVCVLSYVCFYGAKSVRRTGIRVLWFLPALLFLLQQAASVANVLSYVGDDFQTLLVTLLGYIAGSILPTAAWILAGLWITAVPKTAGPVYTPPVYTPPVYTPPVYTPPVRPYTPPVQPQADVGEELKRFKDLLDAGVITQEDFDQKKKQLLGL